MVKVGPTFRGIGNALGMGITNHSKCVNGDSCSGPGCRVSTGKTRDDKRPAARRERVKASLARRKPKAESLLGEPDSDGFYRDWEVI